MLVHDLASLEAGAADTSSKVGASSESATRYSSGPSSSTTTQQQEPPTNPSVADHATLLAAAASHLSPPSPTDTDTLSPYKHDMAKRMMTTAMHHVGPAKADAPIGDAFLLRRNFWVNFFAAIVIGLVVGLYGFLFFEALDRCKKAWFGMDEHVGAPFFNDYPKTTASTCLNCGRKWLLGFPVAGGFLLGSFKLLTKYPEGETQTFFQEIKDMNVHAREGFLTSFCGLISLCAGASLGPEAPIGAFGGGFGSWLSHVLKQPKANAEVWAILGMAAGFGALFQSPFLSVIMLLEIAEFNRSRYMEMITLIFVASTVSFAVNLNFKANAGGVFDLQPTYGPNMQLQYTMGWRDNYLVSAIPLGIVSGLLGLIMQIFKSAILKIVLTVETKMCLKPHSKWGIFFTPIIGGLIIGGLAVACPLTLGDGADSLSEVMADGTQTLLLQSDTFYFLSHPFISHTTLVSIPSLSLVPHLQVTMRCGLRWLKPAPSVTAIRRIPTA